MTPSPERTLLLASIDEAFDRKSWHGTNLRGSLKGITPEQALWRPGMGRHNIWEVVLHCAYWKYVVRRRLTGAKRGSFALKGSNFFPSPAGPSQVEWQRVLKLLQNEHTALRCAIEELSPPAFRDAGKQKLIRGVAAHDLYHAGQIQLLKRLMRV